MKKHGIVLLLISLLLAPVLTPEIDLAVSRLFYTPHVGFIGQNVLFFDALKEIANHGARGLALLFLMLAGYSFFLKKPIATISAKAWLFLFAALVIGPGLFANTLFKDHWGRARPREIEFFGGGAQFSPALVINNQCQKNCSFVSGDASFGFYLPCLAFVVAPKARRRTFLALLATGSLFGIGRIVSGAHFLSDVVFASALMMLTNMATYAAFYGGPAVKNLNQSLSGGVIKERTR